MGRLQTRGAADAVADGDAMTPPQPPPLISWWICPPETFSAEAKKQEPRMVADSRGSIVRLKEGPPDDLRGWA